MKSIIKIFVILASLLCITFAFSSCGNSDKDNTLPGDGGTNDSTPNETPDVEVNLESLKIENKEVFSYDKKGKRINCNNQFIEYNNKTYYAINNRVVVGDYIIGSKAYRFDQSGAMLDYVFNNMFFVFKDATYYVVNNTIVRNRVLIGEHIYDFGNDGKMIVGTNDGYSYDDNGRLIANNVFVTVGDETYYVVNSTIVYGNRIINDYIYDFGEDGKMVTDVKGDYTYGDDGKLIADNIFFIVDDNVYFVVDDRVVHEKVVINNEIYDFGNDGKLSTDNVFVKVGDYTYYVVNKSIVRNKYVINDTVYDFGDDGRMVTGEKDGYVYDEQGKLIADGVFVTANGATYYIVNNTIIRGIRIIDDCVYNFGKDGKMIVGTKGDYTYGRDGKLVGNNLFIDIDGATYCIVNNRIVYNQIVINGNVYDFGDNGHMVVGEKDGYVYDSNGRLVADNIFITVKGATYYIVNGVTVYNRHVINEHVYDFGNDGKMTVGVKDGYTYGEDGKLVGNNVFVIVKGVTYCVVGNRITYNQIVVNGGVYNFGNDGQMVIGERDGYIYGEDGRLIADEIFITVRGEIYYIIDNVTAYNRVVIGDYVYDFGTDGKMIVGDHDGYTYGADGKLVANNVFVTVDESIYYIIDNVIVRDQVIVDGAIYYFDNDGRAFVGEKDGYTFGEDGKLVADEEFVEIDGSTYYLVDNNVTYNRIVIDRYVYDFGENGKMVIGEHDGYTYGTDGRLIADGIFIVVRGSTYYIVNNVVAYNRIVIDEYVYDFGEDGKMIIGEHDGYIYGEDGKLIADNILISVAEDIYCIKDNKITYNQIVINGSIYNFGEDGKMVVGERDRFFYGEDGRLVANNKFVTVGRDVYYVVNNLIVYNRMVIGEYVYDFGEDGKMIIGEHDGYTYGAGGKLVANNIFVAVNGSTYYIIDNKIVRNKFIIDDAIYYFGNDGKMVVGERVGFVFGEDGKLIADEEFIVIDSSTYYLVDNNVTYNRIVIDGCVYDFGEDGKMVTGEHDGYTYGADGRLIADEIFIVASGSTYYIVNNIVAYNRIVIDGYVYDFGDDGKMIIGEHDGYTYGAGGRLIANNIFIAVGDATYYIVNNIVVYDHIVINGYLYNFGDDGKMVVGEKDGYTYGADGRLIAHERFVTLGTETYYLIDNVTVRNKYIIINSNVYYFTGDGVRVENTTYGGYTFGSDGYIVAEYAAVVIDRVNYVIVDNIAYRAIEFCGVVYESDGDRNPDNNTLLSGVSVTLTVDGESETVYTDAMGRFSLATYVGLNGTVVFTLDGYIDVSVNIDVDVENDLLVIIMDKEVSNTFSGQAYIADNDNTISNNLPLVGATVTLDRISSTNTLHYETEVLDDGSYSFTGLTAGVYKLNISIDGYVAIEQIVQIRYDESNVYNTALEAVPTPIEGAYGQASGIITDARTGNVVSGLTVYIYSGVNNIEGEWIQKLVTDAGGCYLTDVLVPGNYTAYVVDERTLEDEDHRYGALAISVKVISGCTVSGQGATVSNGIGLDENGIRIVLTWGTSPEDLDSHLEFGGNHLHFGNKIVGNCSLDVDDTLFEGPETITISSAEDYIYKYYVYNYSNFGTMAESGATVNVYFGDSATPAYTFRPPTGSGYYWDVFTYNAITGEFIIDNTLR